VSDKSFELPNSQWPVDSPTSASSNQANYAAQPTQISDFHEFFDLESHYLPYSTPLDISYPELNWLPAVSTSEPLASFMNQFSDPTTAFASYTVQPLATDFEKSIVPELTTTSASPVTSSQPSHSPAGSSRVKSGRKRNHSPESEGERDKRRRNNKAAAKYRQKKVDRIDDLEKALDEVSKERDALKLQLARRDAEVELLNRMLSEKRSVAS